MEKTEVVVVGSGPTGLMLANELALASVDVVVLEKLSERSGQSKALNLQPRSAELLHMRGLIKGAKQRALATLPLPGEGRRCASGLPGRLRLLVHPGQEPRNGPGHLVRHPRLTHRPGPGPTGFRTRMTVLNSVSEFLI